MSNPRGRPATDAAWVFSPKRLARRLRARGISGSELAKRCSERQGIYACVDKYLRKGTRPSIEAVKAMAVELCCSMDDFMEKREDAA